MLGFSKFVIITEELNRPTLSKGDAGKIHEVLTGGLIHHYAQHYQQQRSSGMSHEQAHKSALKQIENPSRIEGSHLLNVTHMPQFRDTENKTAEQLHNELGNKLAKNTDAYNDHVAHAQHAAKSIIDHLHSEGIHDIKGVHFTANKNDIKNLPGYSKIKDSTNNSDIVVEHGHKDIGNGYYGFSIKSGATSKLNNPGQGKLNKFIDEHYEKITGKKSTYGQDVADAEAKAREEHLKILEKHKDFLQKHFGENGLSYKGGLRKNKDGSVNIHPKAFKFLENAEKEHHADDYSNEDDRKRFLQIYNELRDSRTEHSKRRINESLGKHLQEIFAAQKDESKRPLINDFMKKLTNVGREEGQMPLARINTMKNSPTSIKNGGPERSSEISKADEDFNKHFSHSIGGYSVRSKPGTIYTDIVGPSGHKLSLITDSSPAGGGTMRARQGLHVMDQSEKPPSVVKPSEHNDEEHHGSTGEHGGFLFKSKVEHQDEQRR